MSTLPAVSPVKSTVGSATYLWSTRPTWSERLSRLTSSKQHRYPRLKIPPSRILSLRIRTKTEKQKRSYRHLFQYAAQQRSDRLALVTFQAWMAKQDIQDEPELFNSIRSITPSEWADRFYSLGTRGWSREDVHHWIWIISAEDGDARVERLISTERPKPTFLITLVARSNETFRQGTSLLSLMEYVSKHYMNFTSPSLRKGDKAVALSGPEVNLTVPEFLLLLRRLVNHTQRSWPRSIVSVARFTVDYIQALPPSSHWKKSEVFNTALQYFKLPAANQPITNMEFNWRAQRLLLSMSDHMDTPLVINKASYRAIREVMIGLKKSATERAVAVRYSKSWPPYRQDFDGFDAKRTAEDDYSRSVKAGVLMKESGYTDDNYDRALSALGGLGQNSPTIQTRSLPPKEWKGEDEDQNFYSLWAMRIRATRNSQEAWKVFNDVAAETDKPPNTQVYAEMFMKLHAHPVHENSTALPGDSRENFPIHDANYSEYELARLSPPTVTELYDRMISHGVKPEGHCLNTLLMNANSLEEGTGYLRDSGMNSATINALGLFKQPSYDALRRIPLLLFKSYIQLLCRLHPNRQGQEKISLERLFLIRHAINLVKLRLRHGTTEGSTFLPPWVIILRAIARPHICVINDSQAKNDAEALSIAMDVVESMHKRTGVNADAFLYLCRAVGKAALSRLESQDSLRPERSTTEPPLIHYHQVLDTLKHMFSQLTAPFRISASKSIRLKCPDFTHSIGPAQLHAYMRALAFLEDTVTMKDLLRWILTHRSYVDEEAERIGSRGHALVAKTLCAFQAFAGPNLGHKDQEDLTSRMESSTDTGTPWRWPTLEEVDAYIQSDLRGGSRKLQHRILAKSWHASSREEIKEDMGELFT
ncbi:uncharacterized protein F4812DRAFT_440944 [Daldinia caldariorum]|uniref:uncharacterized protein n=1 Tax=Daldinia caldariorum TaxID=326644 RepID=UPI002007E909|nr:uncharacterized protein F4812DRAFT_440944 [Daldinia caldariorum]KAI1464912.1 hypothetical protein F4812DRAFT_440944 [Daldinia caldariorum]